MKIVLSFVLSFVLSVLAACGMPTKPRVVVSVKPVTERIKIICISKDDVLTPATAEQIRADNVGLAALNMRKAVCKRGKKQ